MITPRRDRHYVRVSWAAPWKITVTTGSTGSFRTTRVRLLCDLLSKTLKANFVQLFAFCGVSLESSSFFNSILALRTVKLSRYRPYFDAKKQTKKPNSM